MELTHEDQLRLNVLLANPVDAIRIDEQALTVYALSGEGELLELTPKGLDTILARRLAGC